MRFRPCIDLHGGRVKQIVGSSLRDGPDAGKTETHFETADSPARFAEMFRRDGLEGGHVIMLGPGNEAAAGEALGAFPGGLQIGGGIDPGNAAQWLERGASRVIATSFLFDDGVFSPARLAGLVAAVGRERLVLDLSCARRDGRYLVMSNRWQTWTELAIDPETLGSLAGSCCEFLVHAVEVEGKQAGPDLDLVELLSGATPIPTTYAGGIRSLADIEAIERLGRGRLDFTVGSALDIFGGHHLRYADLAVA